MGIEERARAYADRRVAGIRDGKTKSALWDILYSDYVATASGEETLGGLLDSLERLIKWERGSCKKVQNPYLEGKIDGLDMAAGMIEGLLNRNK